MGFGFGKRREIEEKQNDITVQNVRSINPNDTKQYTVDVKEIRFSDGSADGEFILELRGGGGSTIYTFHVLKKERQLEIQKQIVTGAGIGEPTPVTREDLLKVFNICSAFQVNNNKNHQAVAELLFKSQWLYWIGYLLTKVYGNQKCSTIAI